MSLFNIKIIFFGSKDNNVLSTFGLGKKLFGFTSKIFFNIHAPLRKIVNRP